MSAWLCGNKTLSLCVDIIQSNKNEYNIPDEYQNKNNNELLNELSELNTKSLNCRYGKSTDHILNKQEYIKQDVEEGQRYKSVRCYLYQTCECDENYEHPLFKILDEWSDDHEELGNNWGNYHWDIDNPR